jgi:hypothetical protein
MSIVEITIAVGAILASVTLCAVKLLKQLDHSRCVFISCLGSECIRSVDTENESEEIEIEDVLSELPIRPTLITPIINNIPSLGNVQALKRNYEHS